MYVIGESSLHHITSKRKQGNPVNYSTHFCIHTYVHTYMYVYYISSCTYISLHRCSSYHTQFRLLGKGTDEASSDIDVLQESSETTHSEENRDLSLSQSVRGQKMSEEISEAEVTSCK